MGFEPVSLGVLIPVSFLWDKARRAADINAAVAIRSPLSVSPISGARLEGQNVRVD
jgi:hypothetical protein